LLCIGLNQDIMVILQPVIVFGQSCQRQRYKINIEVSGVK